MTKEQRRTLCWVLIPGVAFLAVVSIGPFAYLINLAFRDYYLLKPFIPRVFVGVKNFVKLVSDGMFLRSIVNTLMFVGISMAAQFGIGLGLAFLLNRNLKGKALFLTLLISPMVIAPVVVGLIWLKMYNSQWGEIYYLASLFVNPERLQFLTNPRTALLYCIVVATWQWTPFMLLILYSGLQGLPKEPFEAARIEGASSGQILKYITMPLLKPVILVALFIRMIDAFKVFDTLYVLTGGGPANSTEVMSLYTYRVNFVYFNMGYGAAVAFCLLFTVIAICMLFYRTFGIAKH